MGELWGEVKEWRKFWDRYRFFQVLFLGLAASLFDSLTDFNFAQSVETDCNTTDRWLNSTTTPFDRSFVSSPCGLMYYKTVERLTYIFICYPTIYLWFDYLPSLAKEMMRRCCGSEMQGITPKIGAAISRTVEVFLCVALYIAAHTSEFWERDLPHLATMFDFTIRAMAYLSIIIIVGIKCLGLISHGPKTRRVIFHATGTERRSIYYVLKF